jgi:hypothetical protein
MTDLVRRDLFEALSPHLAGAVVGTCVMKETGREVAEYISVYTMVRHTVFMRGKGCEYDICRWCRLPKLHSGGAASTLDYFDRRQLSARHAYQLEGHCGFLISPWLRDRIDWNQFKDIELYAYPVVDEPLDGMDFSHQFDGIECPDPTPDAQPLD